MMLTVNKKKLCDNELIHAGFRLCEEINRYGYEAYQDFYVWSDPDKGCPAVSGYCGS